MVEGHECVDAVIDYHQDMELFYNTEGVSNAVHVTGGSIKKVFDITYTPFINVQRHSNYTHNGVDKVEFDLKY